MRIEYIADGAADAPLLRIFGFTAVEFTKLVTGFGLLAREPGMSLWIAGSETSDVVAATSGKRDSGVTCRPDGTFEWSLTPDSWSDVRDRAAALDSNAQNGFQWLSEAGGVFVLLSQAGTW
jgi:hypothetical protein